MDKVSLRNLIKVELRKMPQDEWINIGEEFNQIFFSAYSYFSKTYHLSAQSILGVFSPQKFEPQLNWDLIKKKIEIKYLAYPQLENGALLYRLWKEESPPSDWKQVWKGEPIKPNIIFVPALTLNKQGYRLGQGGGHFDQYLESEEIKIKVGMCINKFFDHQWKPEKHDHPFDYVLTEKGLWKVSSAKLVDL